MHLATYEEERCNIEFIEKQTIDNSIDIEAYNK